MKIRAYLVLMACAILLPVTILLTVALTMLQNATRAEALRGLQETARATALAVDRELGSAESALRVLASSVDLANGNLRDFYRKAKVVEGAPGTWTVLLDREGRQLVNTVLPYGETPVQPVTAGRAAKVLRGNETFVSNLTTGPVTKRLVATVNVPVTLDDGQQYVLVKAFAVEYFHKIFSEPRIPDNWVGAILDRDGVLISRSRGASERVGKPARSELIRTVSASREGTIRVPTLEGIDSYAAYTRTAMGDWTIVIGAPVDAIEAPAQRATVVAGLGILGALACAIGAAFFFGRRLTRSIHHAVDAAALLSRGHPPATVEYGVAELDDLHRAMRETGTVLQVEMTIRKQAETKMASLLASEQAARQEAQQQNQRKDAFLAMLGHELRNPLSAISSAVTVLRHEAVEPEASLRARDIIQRQSQHLKRIVDDLLDLTRFMTGKIKLQRESVELASIVRRCVDSMRETGQAADHDILVDTTPALVHADATRMEQLINNLLVNAVKYTPKNGKITVTLDTEGGNAILRVRDSGVGISADLLPHVFDIFVQGPASIDRSQGGLGVGLALVRQLALLHEGSVTAESIGIGSGSTFTLRLPLSAPVAAVAQPVTAAPLIARKVIVIEDNDDGREMIVMALELRGHRVLQAANGSDGLTIAVLERPDIAVIDIGLPDLDGYEVARRLRAEASTAGMRLIALTGYGQKEDHDRALTEGFDKHLTKPVDLERLLQTMASLSAVP